MSFNEENTIENALRDSLVAGGWKYVHGENLVLYGKQPQDVFVDTWLKETLWPTE